MAPNPKHTATWDLGRVFRASPELHACIWGHLNRPGERPTLDHSPPRPQSFMDETSP